MEFFNKKEEVLDVELTEYGKYLLAIGQLNPLIMLFLMMMFNMMLVAPGFLRIRTASPTASNTTHLN